MAEKEFIEDKNEEINTEENNEKTISFIRYQKFVTKKTSNENKMYV